MEEALNSLLENSSVPLLSAFILGLMTAISPCPLATNITAVGFIGKDIENRNRVFYNGLIYTLGRAITYTGIAAIIFLGADQLALSGWFQQYGEKILGPLLIIIGLFMLGIFKINFPGVNKYMQRYQEKGVSSFWEVLFIGILFALAFCPYSGVLYFGMLIPMTLSSGSGLALPVVFAIATGIPVIIFAWLLAYTIAGVGKFYNGLKVFEKWFRRVVAVLFIGIGLYYVIIIYF
ncbi:MAG: aromatic aminobenezylarsenical efflux permease ArsG family transporter [Bacteroidales bacterium]